MSNSVPKGRQHAALVLFALGFSAPLAAQDLRLRPPVRVFTPQVRLAALQVKGLIQDGVATTEVRQTFANDGGSDAEAEWILPLPDGAAPDRFTMTVNGKDTPGEVLDANHARQVYEEIVRRRRDPGLLEYFGTGCLRARVFPIAPRGECQVVVRYKHLLPLSGGVATWFFPLRAATANGTPAERISLELTIDSKVPLKSVYSPLGGVDIVRRGENAARATFESQKGLIPERDLTIYYGISDQAFGLTLLSTKKPGEDGTFMALISPKQDWPEAAAQGRAITFVVDTSGSMQGKKIEQAKEALRFFLRSLRPVDFFNVVTFATEAQPFAKAMQVVTKDSIDAALEKVAAIEAKGGTNIEDALTTALSATIANVDGRSLVPIVVFLTDGQPTVATTDADLLLAKVTQANKVNARVFVFGVGNDVNTRLLDKIAEKSRADRDYVREDEGIEIKTGALFTKLSHPVMTDIVLTIDGIETKEVMPKSLPDVFCGGRLVVLGRYRGEGPHAIRLQGMVDGKRTEYVFEGTFAAGASGQDFLPALWANARVTQLLDAIRLNGAQPELVAEVQRLGKEYQIVTPYTSHLVLEDSLRVARHWAPGSGPGTAGPTTPGTGGGAAAPRVAEELRRAGVLPADRGVVDLEESLAKSAGEAKDARKRMDDLPTLVTGDEAVKASLQGRSSDSAYFVGRVQDPRAQGAGAALAARRVGDLTFHLVQGVWVDSRIQAQQRQKAKKLAAFSDEYFALLRANPGLAPVFAFSTRIVLVLGEEVYEFE